MAKIKKINCRPTLWLVKVSVKDPSCIFSINPEISYMRLVKAFNSNAAVKAAATYCNKKMKEYPGTFFTYSSAEVTAYYYPLQQSFKEEAREVCYKTKI
jgi:hypothetical protein